MSWSASIHIRLYRHGSVSQTLTTLREAGWGFVDGVIHYDHFSDPDGPSWGERQAPESAWLAVLEALEARLSEGETINVEFYWKGRWGDDGVHITCQMSRPDDLLIMPDASAPRLEESRPFTDFTWLLRRTVLPLVEAGYDLQSVECGESH